MSNCHHVYLLHFFLLCLLTCLLWTAACTAAAVRLKKPLLRRLAAHFGFSCTAVIPLTVCCVHNHSRICCSPSGQLVSTSHFHFYFDTHRQWPDSPPRHPARRWWMEDSACCKLASTRLVYSLFAGEECHSRNNALPESNSFNKSSSTSERSGCFDDHASSSKSS